MGCHCHTVAHTHLSFLDRAPLECSTALSMAAKKQNARRTDVTFSNIANLADNQQDVTPSASPSRAPKWRALKWALKFSSTTPTEPSAALELERPREYKPPDISYHQCFKELNQLSQLLSLLASKSDDLTNLLEIEESGEREGGSSTVTSPSSESAAATRLLDSSEMKNRDSAGGAKESADRAVQPESVQPYQEFVDMFMSIFLHSNYISFLGGVSEDIDKLHIVHTLVNKISPELPLFRRVCVCPKYIASQLSDSSNDNVYRNIPVNQLARFCDVAVLRFLSTATEHTNRESVIWCIEYLRNLLDSLHASLTKLNSYGWYGAPPLRTRKGTMMGRHSITYPPILSPFATPPVVVVGTPPASPARTLSTTPSPEPSSLPFLDPETGQRSPLSPLSRGVSPPVLGRRGRGSFPPSAGSEPIFHGVGGATGRGRQRRISREEHLAGALKPSPFNQPPTFHLSHSWEGPTHLGPSSPPPSELLAHGDVVVPQIQHASPSRQSMQSIPEEDGDSNLQPTDRLAPTPGVPARTDLEEGAVEVSGAGLQQSLVGRGRSPQPPQLHRIQEEERGGGGGGDRPAVGIPPEIRSESPGLSGILSPGSSLSSLGDDEEVRSKPTAAVATPLGPKDIPKVNLQKELTSLMNGEGRISLLAILQAISRLPQTQELWLGDMGEKCFTLIQLCMDLGLRISSGEDTLPKPPPQEAPSSSGKERRRQFQNQKKNSAFHEHSVVDGEAKPSKVHSQYVVEFSVRALIHCATSLIVGCTSDPSHCRLRHIHLPDQSISTYNTLTRLLKRVYTFSPRCFHQALSDFAKPSGSSCRRLFQFLHIMLQYCTHPMDSHLNVFLMSIVSAVLRESIDRLVQLDITEASIQNVSDQYTV